MDGKIALEEHFSTQMNDRLWDSSGEAGRNGPGYARDVERRLVDLEACVFEMDRAGIEMCIMSLTSPGVQSVTDPGKALALARDANDYATSFIKAHPDRLSSFAAGPPRNWGWECVAGIFAPVLGPGVGRGVDFEVGGSRGRGSLRGHHGDQQA